MLKIVGDICLSDIHLDVGLGVGTKISNGHNPFAHLQKKKMKYGLATSNRL